MSLFANFDGSGRQPRDVQLKALMWVEEHLSQKAVSLRLPTGSGKTAIAVSIMKAFPDKQVCIVVPNNVLVKQYVSEYNLTHLIGKSVMDPEERTEARDLVLEQRQSFVTNASWLIHNRIGKFSKKCSPDIVILDECDQCIAYSRNEQTTAFDIKTDNPFVVKDYLKKREAEMQWEKAIFQHAMKRSQAFFMDYREEEAKTHLHYTYLDSLVASALKGADCTILMSATLSYFDHQELMIPKSHRKIFDGDHPIPEEQRPVLFEPKPQHFEENIRELALEIVSVYKREGSKNTLVHVTYDDQKKLYPILKELLGDKVIMNHPSRDAKDACIRCLERRSDVLWVAAGVSEGVDLKDELCRLQIIPRVIFPNMGDLFVQKRIALVDGQEWYGYQALRQLMQSAGRCCRNPKDFGKTIIFDYRLPFFIETWKKFKLIPKWFQIRGINHGKTC